MAAHDSVGVLLARPRKPKDKAAVEAGVRFAQYYILGRMRNVTFLPGRVQRGDHHRRRADEWA